MTPTTETWLPIPGWEGLYEVSDLGSVRSLDRLVDNGSGTPWRRPGRRMQPTVQPDTGRRTVRLTGNGRRERPYVYALVLTAFVGPRPAGMVACHGDGDTGNDQLSNLRWDSQGENNRDAVRHGTHHNTRKTQCLHGHALRAPNLMREGRGRRACLACNRARWTVGQARRRGVELDFDLTATEHYAQIMEEATCPAI